MPRREAPDSLALAVGQRIRSLRAEVDLSIQDLADQSEIGSKGHLSNVERGLVRPNIQTVKQVADGLGVLPLDLLTFPERDVRQRVVDFTRRLSIRQLSELLRWIAGRSRSSSRP
jgi:transcriptional regulator with XRE-family HTH domain